jgi:radical SAM superfamily enzyme YgiQ (UPF0313 family)
MAKKHGFQVILGGPESANYPQEYLNHGADVIVLGEGEQTLEKLLPAIQNPGSAGLQAVDGIVFKDKSGNLITTNPRISPNDLAIYPWPDRESIDIRKYLQVWRDHHGLGSISMITARGCPYRCTWCSHAVYGYSHRRRKPADCASELDYIMNEYSPDQIWYADDVFTISHPWLYEYSAQLKNRGLKVPFETISRADRLMKPEVLDTLVEMGCDRIWIGSESGSQKILDAMQRDVTVEQIQWASHELKKRGIKVGMFLMWGYGNETLEDIEKTVEHVKISDPDVFFTTIAYPIKNTPFYNEFSDSITMSGDWASGTDRDYKISNQRGPEYYKAADILLFNSVEASRNQYSDHKESLIHKKLADDARLYLQEYERKHIINKTGI